MGNTQATVKHLNHSTGVLSAAPAPVSMILRIPQRSRSRTEPGGSTPT